VKPSELTALQAAELAHEHADAELHPDLEKLMATLVAEPVFEFHPPGRSLRGGEQIRRHYTQFLANFMPQVESTQLLGEWGDENAVVQEYTLSVRGDDGELESHRVVAVLYMSGTRMGGERIYGSEKAIRMMLGEMYAELQEIDA